VGFVRVKAKAWNVERPEVAGGLSHWPDRRDLRASAEEDAGIIGFEVQGARVLALAVFGGVHLPRVTTLEELGLEVDPVKGELRPMELLMRYEKRGGVERGGRVGLSSAKRSAGSPLRALVTGTF
jgi:hypothetical protein